MDNESMTYSELLMDAVIEQYLEYLDRGGEHPDLESLPLEDAIEATKYMAIIDLLRL